MAVLSTALVWSPVMAPVTSKSTTPSNGAVTAVKTCQVQKQSSSSTSAPSQEPVPSSWESIEVELPPRATATQLFELRALPLAMIKGRGKGNSRRHKAKELNCTLGNDNKIPWCKSLKDKSVISVVSMLQPQSFLTVSNVPTFAGLSFVASSVDNFSNLALVFDQYYITLIECLVYPEVTEVTTSATAVGNYVTAVDVDDATAPTTYSQTCSYASSQSGNLTMQHYHRWKPQYAVAAYSGAFTSYSVAEGWIDCSSPNVQHYGLKGASSGSTVSQNVLCSIKYHMLFSALH